LTEPDALSDHTALLQALRDPSSYPHAVRDVQLIETHISSVLLAGDYAYKLKKPVKLSFADFSTLTLRRHYCEEEIRLNCRTAPQLYLDVVAIAGTPPRFCGDGEAIEYAVRMRRFSSDARLDQLARDGKLTEPLIDRLAAAVANFHRDCEPVSQDGSFGTPELIRRWVNDNLAELRQLFSDAHDQQRVAQLAHWTEAEFDRRIAVFLARRAAGLVRECHGDLHLCNVALVDGEPLPFDCIEFNPELRFIDVASDAAFLWMDLFDQKLPRLAARFLNAYLEATGDYNALAILRFYAVYRALVRAKVALIRRDQAGTTAAERAHDQRLCLRYLDVAERLSAGATAALSPERMGPTLLLMCGVSGSGKTTVAQHLLQHLGAVRVRSDIERKRLAGIAASEHRPSAVGTGLYKAAITERTYTALEKTATQIVDAGFTAVVDAASLQRSIRQRFATLAKKLSARFAVVLCEASPIALQTRVKARAELGADASDATVAVLAHQLQTFEAPAGDELQHVYRLHTDIAPEALASRCQALALQLIEEETHV